MAFAQLTFRDSLRDIEICLRALKPKLFHAGFRGVIARSTLADANETRDWRIYAELAQRLIVQARKLYANEDLGLDLTNTPYMIMSGSNGMNMNGADASAAAVIATTPTSPPNSKWPDSNSSAARLSSKKIISL